MDTKKLRQKILDLAIHGKLVPQDPNDEPASVLLERIRKEKEQLIKEGKIKAPKKSKTSSDMSHYPKEGPWKLPNGWVWSYLGEISDYGKCITVPVSAINDDEWVLELEDIEKDTGRLVKQIAKRERSINGSRHAFSEDQVLFSKLRTYLNKVLVAPSNGYCTTEIIPISPQSGVLPEYLNLVLRSPYFLDYTAQCGYGVKMPRLGTSDAIKALIPIPPHEEQRRIVESVGIYSDIIELIQSEKERLAKYVSNCKSVILDLAIHGKLVPQDPNDEPAIELLKRINPDFKPSDNLHYEGTLPVGWSLCRLEDILEYEQPQAYIVKSTDYSEKYETPVLTPGKSFILGHTNESDGICNTLPVIIFDDFTTESKYVDFPFKVKSSAMKILRVKGEIDIRYVTFFMSITRLTGDTHKRYWISEYSKLCIPLPPLQEQKRIVAKIVELNEQLDRLSADIQRD
ncbi:MAG: restriction endonuclease subunit S [Bacteroidales bacterium]|nr:restriction endonuclease subunit S [Bacteroidales bacterium]